MRPLLLITALTILVPGVCLVDDLLYRYKGDVLPYDPAAG